MTTEAPSFARTLAYIAAWDRQWRANGKRTILDGDPLPENGTRHLTIYRGQGRADPLGAVWYLTRATAARLIPAGTLDPVVITARVHRRMVMAYLTGRDEAEVIVDPFLLPNPYRLEASAP